MPDRKDREAGWGSRSRERSSRPTVAASGSKARRVEERPLRSRSRSTEPPSEGPRRRRRTADPPSLEDLLAGSRLRSDERRHGPGGGAGRRRGLSRPDAFGSGSPGHGRDRGDPQNERVQRGPDNRPVGSRGAGPEDQGARCWSGRLRHQTLLHGGVAGSSEGGREKGATGRTRPAG